MSSNKIKDIFDNLMVENKRLFDELMFANKILSEIKSFIELIFEKYENTFDSNDTHFYEKLVKEAEEVVQRDKTFKEFDFPITTDKRRIGDEREEHIECEVDINSLQSRDNGFRRPKKRKKNIETKEVVCDNSLSGPKVGSDHPLDENIQLEDRSSETRTMRKNRKKVFGKDISLSNSLFGNQDSDPEISGEDKDKTFECKTCGKSYSNRGSLCNHKRDKHNSTGHSSIKMKYRCTFQGCTRSYQSAEMLRSHSQSHITGQLKCPFDNCDKVFDNEPQVSKHLHYHRLKEPENRRKYACDWPGCEYRDSTQATVNRHKLYVHAPDSMTRRFPCAFPGCGKVWKAQAFLNAHMKTHLVEQVQCDMCDRVFKNRESLSSHRIRYHLREKNLKCEYPGCEFRCAYESQLNTHKVSHSEIRPFFCSVDGCDKRFASEHLLKQHIDTHSTELKFKCPFDGCPKAFRTEQYMKAHYRNKHSGQEYRCDWPGCDYYTDYLGAIKSHSSVHKSSRDFWCDWPQCNKRFKTKQNLTLHKRLHTNDQRYTCDWPGCDYRTAHSGNYRKHKNNVHQKTELLIA